MLLGPLLGIVLYITTNHGTLPKVTAAKGRWRFRVTRSQQSHPPRSRLGAWSSAPVASG